MLRLVSDCEHITSVVCPARHLTRACSVNKVVPKSELLATALAWAAEITSNSPDSVQSTKRALLLTKQLAHVEDVVAAHIQSQESKRHFAGENIKVHSCLRSSLSLTNRVWVV